MLGVPFILADTDYFGAIAVVVVLIIWAARAMSAIAKKSQRSPPKPRFAPPPQLRSTETVTAPPLAARAVLPARPAHTRPAALPPIANLIVSLAPTPLQTRPVKSPAAPPLPPKRKDPIASPVPAALLPRTQFARLTSPKSLRSQFILAEALKPPLALRNESPG